MSPLASLRFAAVLFSLLAFGCQLGLRLLHRVNPTMGDTLFHLVGILTMVLAGAAYFAIIAPHRRPPATFTVTPGRFTAPTSPYLGLNTIALGWFAGYLVGVPAAAALALAAGLLFFLPKVTLTPTHLVVRHLWTRRFAWEAVGPGCVERKRGAVEVEVLNLLGKWRTLVLGARTRHVDSAFLARAIQDYVEHPENRARIGEDEELTRLKALPPKEIEQTVTETWPQWLPSENEQV